jgi:hypothetical protein
MMVPLYHLWKPLFSKFVTTTRQIGLAMILVAKRGASKKILGAAGINDNGEIKLKSLGT